MEVKFSDQAPTIRAGRVIMAWNTAAPWHQDCAYYQPSPNVIVSAWIAVDDTTKHNGAMRIILGSHKKLVK
jgi:ectoine hydroxylase-related dioxygenase (phytanoyl-CoA dioxygenase family)